MKIEHINRIMRKAVEGAIQEGEKITVSVSDSTGKLVGLISMEGSFPVSADFATAKSYTSAVLGMPTSGISEYSAPGKPYYSVESLSSGKFTSISGGVPVKDGDKIVGAVGVGGSYDVSKDEKIAQAAAAA